MNQLAAAVALAQLEKAEHFIDLRRKMGLEYKEVINKSELLTAQYEPDGFYYTYYTFSAKFNGSAFNIKWEEFKKNILNLEVMEFMQLQNYYTKNLLLRIEKLDVVKLQLL